MIARLVQLLVRLVGAGIVWFILIKMITGGGRLAAFPLIIIGWLALMSLWSIARSFLYLLNYLTHPFQQRMEYFVTGPALEQFSIEPILLHGPCLLVFSSDVIHTAVAFGRTDTGQETQFLQVRTPELGVQYKLANGIWPLRLRVQLPRKALRPFRLYLGRSREIQAKLTLEIRGRARLIRLPDQVQSMVRAFPVLLAQPREQSNATEHHHESSGPPQQTSASSTGE